jgi:hypothetical protein
LFKLSRISTLPTGSLVQFDVYCYTLIKDKINGYRNLIVYIEQRNMEEIVKEHLFSIDPKTRLNKTKIAKGVEEI